MARFDPSVFNVRSIADAKAIILTPEDATTDERWAKETPYFTDLIVGHMDLTARSRVMDYGCGIGRLSKSVIECTGCMAVGVDTSVSMRALAPAYVLSDRFLACPPGMLDVFGGGLTHALAVWVLQHIPDLDTTIGLIHQNLRSFGKLFVVNQHRQALPMSDGTWADDGKDVRELLSARFEEIEHGAFDAEHTTASTARSAWWGIYQRRS
jgi:SAM-dependent methyltransferase